MTGSDDILLQEHLAEGVLRLVLNDVPRRNALSENMLEALTDMLAQAGNDPQVRVIILAAHGPAFSAGHDLKELTARRVDDDHGRAYFTEIMRRCSTLMQGIVKNPKPVIAEVAGVATAAGCQLVASCDLAVASESARFSTPGVHIGLFCSTPMVALSRNLSNKHAMGMLLTGDMIQAQRAMEMGLVNQVVDDDSLSSVTQAWATKIASKSQFTLAVGKQAFYRQRDMTLTQAYHYASEVMVENMLAQDAKEGIDAFLNKRQPNWQDQ